MFSRIRWRIAVVFAVLILVCIGGLSAYLSHFFRGNYIDNLRSQLTDQAQLIEDNSLYYFNAGQIEEIDTLAKRLGEQIDGRVTVISEDGTVLGDSEEDPSVMENHADRPEVIEALAEGTGSSIRHSATLGYDMMYVAVPVLAGDQVVGIARVALPLTEIDQSLQHINRTIIIAAVIAAAIAVLLAFQISKATTGPVAKLTQASARMAKGDLGQEIEVTSRDEVGNLALAFNQMAARIKEMVATVTSERDRMAAILSNMADGILLVDGDRVIRMLNPAAERILGLPSEDSLGRTFVEVVRDYELNGVLERCLSAGEPQTTLVEMSPSKQFLGVIATPLHGQTGCLLLVHDLTQIRRLETVRRDFVANISHELRTPIASLKALTETLRDGAIADQSVASDFLNSINVEVDRLAQMVQELSDLSRIESGEAPLHKEPVDIAQTIGRAVGRLEALAERAELEIVQEIDSGLPKIVADDERVEQVLVNLIHNAIKFTPPHGRIHITAKAAGDNALISVADTGVGIPVDDLSRIFERFYKADKARAGEGTGMGLAIAKHIVEAHGGKIWAESVEGRGATFYFTLPLVA